MFLRYQIIKWLYPFLKCITSFYFILLNMAFKIYCNFQPKSTVQPIDDELLLLSAIKAAEKIRNKTITSEELVFAYINRIKKVNPIINAVIKDNFAAAIDEAKNVDKYLDSLNPASEEYNNLLTVKPLLGVPFTCKDNIRVKDFITVAGSPKFVGNTKNERDAECVQRLRDSGAILIGITNLPILAMNWSCESPVYGRTNNPYDTRRIPGGSSGGEGAIIAAAGSLFGPGNDLGGSVRIPALMSGVFGLKPTMGLVSLDGMVPEITDESGKQQWVIGPLCRFADDLGVVLEIMIGRDRVDEHKLHLHDSVDFRKVRVFYMEDLNIVLCENLNADMRTSVRKAVKHFENEFEVMAQRVDFPLAHHMYEIWGPLGFAGEEQTFGQLFNEYRKLLKGESELTFVALAYAFLHLFVKPYSNEERDFLTSKREKLRKGIEKLLGKDGILLFPAFTTPATFHNQNTFTPFNLPYTELFNILGLPAVSCPLGLNNDGIPVGVQIVGSFYSEGLLIAAAKELEKGFGGWVSPGK